ncbi:RICIN domain-containing protein [Streptomyces sp. S.PNR 29]|uniref:RICIN domain-containing protein n=1 Tax=Streptomyces sp. S.PNR 29 TaxID=2973805 RepID=UPI0025AEE078|nr:RICIN domain-containing protein [Streptomyces sp. S.PNR 29]MDN0197758.1 RICIN domain-containing protein [Streptomyces sp. S.PNR 29]
MPTPHPPRPAYPPSGGDPGDSDESLAARLRGRPEGESAHAVALLMARHWQAVHDYAVICLASSADVADMVTAAAFRRLLDRLALGESAVALRPRLLLAVRDTVREWSADDRISGVLPDLQKPAGGRGMRAAKSLTPENRVLAERAFQSLPGLARCLLWHTEVEAEPITIPAGLSGVDAETASVMLEQARDQFREGCVHAHRELAPTKDCRFYNRLLDVPIRRGGALLPDVQQHLAECRYCRHAADQLNHFEGGLGALIAESVLGWGARRYLDSRPDRAARGECPKGAARHRRRPGGGPVRLLSRIPAPGRRIPGEPRSSRAVLRGVSAASAGVLVTVLVVSLLSPGGDGADPAASTSAVGGSDTAPGTVSPTPPDTAGLPTAPGQTRLRNVAADLCLDIRGEAKAGASAKLAVCSAAWTQQWRYEDDGLLRSVADPELCLDSHKDAGVVILGECADEDAKRADDVRYDLTVQGELLPRWEEQLALTSTTRDPDADIVVKVRDGSPDQSWRTDSTPVTAGSLSTTGKGASAGPIERADA